ncbi:ester cyclase [Pseudonocardia sp. GCM10023141]|uniref:ester cyclase n=1 Tax=Pseudonocardia sp. GCM10023141 TaxID=3252653 RepID=UPI00361FC48B
MRDFFEAINERRLDDLGEFMAADVIDHNKIIHGEPDEPGAAFDAVRQQLSAFGEGGMFPEELIAEGDPVVARLTVRGTTPARIRGCPSRIFTMAAGKSAEIRAVSDRLGMFLQLGWDWPTDR